MELNLRQIKKSPSKKTSTNKEWGCKNLAKIGIISKQDLKCIRRQLDEHLQVINENTSETQSNYEYLTALEGKLDKLAERIDQVQLYLQLNGNYKPNNIERFEIRPLTRNEQYVFLVLYALEDEKGAVSYLDISRKTGFSVSLVRDYVSSIIEKGVPLVKKYINNLIYLKINKDFKMLQAKENILMIDTAQRQLLNF